MHNEDTRPLLKSGPYDLVQENENGDISTQAVLLHVAKKHIATDLGGWFVQWQETTMNLAQNKEMTLTDWRVLAVLQAKLDFDNWIRLSQTEIGKTIDVAQPNVSKSMTRLIDLKVIIPGPSTRNVRTFRLNPDLAFKGLMRNAVKAKRAAPKLTVVEGGKKTQRQQQLDLVPSS